MIGWYAHHQGAGHVTRLQSVAAHLDEPVWGLSSRPAPPGWTGPWTELARDDDPAPGAGDDVTAGGVLHWAPPHHPGLADRMSQLTSWCATHRPRLLVVDVSVEVALLARLCGVPTVVVALPGDRTDQVHRLAYDSASALLAPWPDAVHTAGWPEEWLAKLWCVGGISRFDGRPAPAPRQLTGRRRVLVLWGSGGRSTGANEVASAREAAPDWDWVERDPVTCPSPDLWADLAEADVVVTHAGQNAVAEVAAARRPAVVVAQPRPFDEQVATASAVDRMGISVGLTGWPAANAWPGLLEQAAGLGGSGWSRWSDGHGAQRAARHMEELAGTRRVEVVA